MKYTRNGTKVMANDTSPSVPLPAEMTLDRPGASCTSTARGAFPTLGDAMTERVLSSIWLVCARKSARVDRILPDTLATAWRNRPLAHRRSK